MLFTKLEEDHYGRCVELMAAGWGGSEDQTVQGRGAALSSVARIWRSTSISDEPEHLLFCFG